jgi:hypothetical protein
MIRQSRMAVVFVLTGCAAGAPVQPAGHQATEEAAVLAVLDAYMREISANDLAAMDVRQTADGMTYRHAALDDGSWEVVARSNKYWVARERADEHTYRERYWSPTVMIRGSMAMVWAPYEFQTDGATSHCGIDVFSFARIDGVWKVSNSMWTVEPNALRGAAACRRQHDPPG